MWQRLWLSFLVAVLLPTLLAREPLPALAAEDVQLLLVFEKKEYKLSEPIEMVVQLKNVSGKPLVVNKRFKIGTSGAPADQKEVTLKVTSASGKEIASTIRDYPTGVPKVEYFEELQRGGAVSPERTWDLKAMFEFKEPGIYQVTATYKNVFGKEIGLDVFRGPKTASAKFKVIE